MLSYDLQGICDHICPDIQHMPSVQQAVFFTLYSRHTLYMQYRVGASQWMACSFRKQQTHNLNPAYINHSIPSPNFRVYVITYVFHTQPHAQRAEGCLPCSTHSTCSIEWVAVSGLLDSPHGGRPQPHLISHTSYFANPQPRVYTSSHRAHS